MMEKYCKDCGKKLVNSKTGLCLPCYNIKQRVLPDVFCEICSKELNRKRPPKSGMCRGCTLRTRNSNPDFIKKIKEGVKRSYKNNPELRNKRSNIGKKYGFGNVKKFRNIMEEKGSWRKKEDISDWELYREKVRKISNENYQRYFYMIPNSKKRSREWHLDHKVSIAFGYENNVDPNIIGHWKNLEVIHHSVNESKFIECSMTLEELKKEINE